MTLTEKIKILYDTYVPYIRNFSLGVILPFAAKTSWRKALDVNQDRDLLLFYKDRSGFSDDENFRDYFLSSERRSSAYVVGMGVGLLGIVQGLIEYSRTQIKSEGDSTILLATMAALTIGNIASILYERIRNSNNKDNLNLDA